MANAGFFRGRNVTREVWRGAIETGHFGLLHTQTIPRDSRRRNSNSSSARSLFVRGEQARIESGETPWSGGPNLWHSPFAGDLRK